jgi:hypothetical protein
LVERASIGHQAVPDEGLPRLVQEWSGEGQALAQRAIGVITQTLSIGHGDEEQVEGAGLRGELIDIALTDQALVYPAEWPQHSA